MKSLKVKFIPLIVIMTLTPLFFPHDHFFPRIVKTQCDRVVDGDTIIADGRRVRLVYIDAPESQQWDRKKSRFVGKISTNYLKKICEGKVVKIQLYGKDRYQRYLGEIYLNNRSLNYEMVQDGMAFIYDYAKFKSYHEKTQYILAYKKAKKSKIGIFVNSTLKPKTFRKRMKNVKKNNGRYSLKTSRSRSAREKNI